MRRHDWVAVDAGPAYVPWVLDKVGADSDLLLGNESACEECRRCRRRRVVLASLRTRRMVAMQDSHGDWLRADTCGPCDGWESGRPMSEAPKGRLILTWSPGKAGLPPLWSLCRWHRDAGFCVDEIREPAYWWDLPS